MREYRYYKCMLCELPDQLVWKFWRPMEHHRINGLAPGLESWMDTKHSTWAVLCSRHVHELRAKTALDALKRGDMGDA